MRDSQIPVRDVKVADEAEAVSADGDGGEPTDIVLAGKSCDPGRATVNIVAMGHLEVALRDVVIADQAQAISSDRDRRELTDLTCLV